MNRHKKRASFRRLLICIMVGAIISGALLFGIHYLFNLSGQFGEWMKVNVLNQDFLTLFGMSTLLFTLLFLFPVNRPGLISKGFLRLVVLVVAMAILWGGGSFYNLQNELIFPRVPVEEAKEAALSQDARYERVTIPGPEKESYQGWWLKSKQPGKAGMILYFGGNGELAATKMDTFLGLQQAGVLGNYHIMMVDYPGYGLSKGTTGEAGSYRMAQAAYEYVKNRQEVDAEHIVLAAWSLGTGTATRLAAEKNPAGMVLIAPYFSGRELVEGYAKNQMHWNIPGFMIPIRNSFSSDEYAKQYQGPVLAIASRDDAIIAYQQSERLEALFANAQLVTIESGGHTAAWRDQNVALTLHQFLQSLLPAAEQPAVQTVQEPTPAVENEGQQTGIPTAPPAFEIKTP